MATAVDSVKNPYRQLLDDNPNSIFSKGSEQRSRRMDAEMASREFDADLALMDYQNEYNSASNVAARERAAGLNPDLLGLQGSDSSGLSGLTGSAHLTKDPNPLESVSSILGNAQNVVESAFNVYQQLQGISSRSVSNDIQRVQLDNLLRGRASQFISDTAGEDPYAVFMDMSMPLSRKGNKRYVKLINTLQTGLVGDTIRNKSRFDWSKSRFDLAGSRSNPLYNDDYEDMLGSLKAWNTFVHNCDEMSRSSQYHKDEYYADYFNNSDGFKDALADRESRDIGLDLKRSEKQKSDFDSFLLKQKKELYGKLNKFGLFGQIMSLSIESGQFGNMVNGAFQGAGDLMSNLLFKKLGLGTYYQKPKI